MEFSVQSTRMLVCVVLLVATQIHGSNVRDFDFATQSTKFTLDLYRSAFNASNNAVMSPISIQSAFALLYHVANEKTSTDMQRILGLPATVEQLVPSLQGFLNRTNNDVLRMASKVFHSQDEALNPKFLPLLRESFGVKVESMDFNQKQQVADSTNLWVDQSTKGMIKHLIDPTDIHDDDKLILLNAITLDAKWEVSFKVAQKKRKFHFVNGARRINMMTDEDVYSFAHVRKLKVLEIPYEEHTNLSMVLIMPTKESLSSFIKRFDIKLYTELLSSMKMSRGHIEIPKFTIDSKIPAKEILESMGLSSAFEKDAFNVFARNGSELSEVKHRAVINVYEGGTTAAAVTAMKFTFRITQYLSYTFIANRPFVYLIRNMSTGEIYFIGHFSRSES